MVRLVPNVPLERIPAPPRHDAEVPPVHQVPKCFSPLVALVARLFVERIRHGQSGFLGNDQVLGQQRPPKGEPGAEAQAHGGIDVVEADGATFLMGKRISSQGGRGRNGGERGGIGGGR